MSADRAACARCGAPLAGEQDYCLGCGARQAPLARPARRAPILAAAVTLAAALTGLGFAYSHSRGEADREAAEPSPRSCVISEASPTVPGGVLGTPAPAVAAPPGCPSSP